MVASSSVHSSCHTQPDIEPRQQQLLRHGMPQTGEKAGSQGGLACEMFLRAVSLPPWPFSSSTRCANTHPPPVRSDAGGRLARADVPARHAHHGSGHRQDEAKSRERGSSGTLEVAAAAGQMR